MNTFTGFIRKEFYHILRDRRTLVILFGMPIIQLMLFGYAIRNEIKEIEVVVVDHANDYVTQEIKNQLIASPYFNIVDQLSHTNGIESVFQEGKAKEAVVFASEFAQRLARDGVAQVQVFTDATDPNTANTILAYTTAVLQDYQGRTLTNDDMGARIIPEVRMRYNPLLKSTYLFVPGLIALILMLVCTLMTSITITREKEMGTMEILLVSPLKPYHIIIGKVIPYLVISVLIVAAILILAHYLFHVPMRGSLPLLLAECTLFIICALSLGILISTATGSQQTAMMISLGALLLPTVILSGLIFPIASMPAPLQVVSHIVPAKWFLIIVRGIMIKGTTFSYIWQETLILVGMTLFFITASTLKFQTRLT